MLLFEDSMLYPPTRVLPAPALAAVVAAAALSMSACATTHRGPIYSSEHSHSWVEAETVHDSLVVVKGKPNADRTYSWYTADGKVVPDDEIVRLTYVRRGRGLLQGAGIGALSGAMLGATIGLTLGEDDCGNCFYGDAGGKALFGGLVVGALGTGAGAVLGLIIGSRDVYEPEASGDRSPGITVRPSSNGGTAAITWEF